MKKLIISIFIFLSMGVFSSEPIGNYYWVQFNTKTGTTYSIDKPEEFLSSRAIERRLSQSIEIDSTDLPVNISFVDSLQSLGFYVKHTSKWMNGAIVILDAATNIQSISKPSFVDSFQLRKPAILKSTSNKFSEIDTLYQNQYGDSFTQVSMLSGHILHEYSKGEGVHIAVIDAGFTGTDQISTFDSLFARNGVLGTYDFVDPQASVYDHHYHGNAVLSIMAGNKPGLLIGAAPGASYWLLRSEDTESEYPIEEDYWIIAAEFADSVGCNVINSSLGYSTFDDPTFDHNYNEFDGKTIRMSQAATLAVNKGIVVVCSAGNSGNKDWRHIVAPSEAEKVLCVAAVDASENLASFSSRGFEGHEYLPKPDISAMGQGTTYATTSDEIVQGNGTSFSSPIIAGMAACLIGTYPEKTSVEIADLIRSLGNRYPEHSLDYGFGIPNFSSLKESTGSQSFDSKFAIYPNPFNNSLTLKTSSDYQQIDIINTNGKVVFSAPIESTKTKFSTLELSKLNKGVYFAVLKGNRQTDSYKLIKY